MGIDPRHLMPEDCPFSKEDPKGLQKEDSGRKATLFIMEDQEAEVSSLSFVRRPPISCPKKKDSK